MENHAYTPRSPRSSGLYQLVEEYYEVLERSWDERYASKLGYWGSHFTKVLWSYLDCGDLRRGFARIRCKDCGHERLLPFSCKRRHFCPSCHERRVLEFAEFLVSEVTSEVPHRHWVFSVPKLLRPWFLYDKSLLGEMCTIVWKLLSKFILASTDGAGATNTKAASVMSIQTAGEHLDFNPHIHALCADGVFSDNGTFTEAQVFDTKALEDAFANAIFALLQEKGLHETRIEMMQSWHHSGFSVYRGSQIPVGERASLERLGQYLVRCPFALRRMVYDKNSGEVSYSGKATGTTKRYSPLDFLARLVVHIPAPHFQTIRYYGHYSNKCRGMRKRADSPEDKAICVLPPKKLASISWARLIAKVFLDDPLICPKCKGQMRIVSFIEEDDLIAKILKHLGLWEPPGRPVANSPPTLELPGSFGKQMDCSQNWEGDFSQLLPEGYADEAYSQLLPDEFAYEAC